MRSNPIAYITPSPYTPDDGPAMEARCANCMGYGEVETAAMRAWRADLDRAHPTANNEREYNQRTAWIAAHPPPNPDTAPCPECGGCGWVLTTRGRALIDFLRRHLF